LSVVPNPVLRTGTDNAPVQQAQPVQPGAQASAGAAQPDYGQYATPSVWRSNRAQAAARVEALSSNGMDEFEIPAFLRKQAD
jgi:cell division protein FtsZ